MELKEMQEQIDKLLTENKAKTVGEAKKMIEDAIALESKSLTDKLEAETKNREALEVKFEEEVKARKEAQAETLRIKTESEAKEMTFGESLEQGFKEEKNLKMLEEFKNKRINGFQMELKAVGTMSLSNITALAAANVQLLPGILPIASRKLHIRQLLPTGQMDTSDIHFLQETNEQGTVTTWADNSGTKPQIDNNLKEAIAPSQFIAAFLKITRKMLDDISAMRSFLQARLIERYLVAEDDQLLNGNGTSPNISGLITNAQAYSGTRTIAVEKIIDACAQVEGNDHQATGILLSPKQYYAILMTRGTTNEYTLPGGSAVNIVNGQIYICGIPVYKSTALFTQLPAQDTFLVGDWSMGAQLFIRENPIVRFFEEDDKNVQQNLITVRVEGRVALPIYYTNAWVTGSLNPTPS